MKKVIFSLMTIVIMLLLIIVGCKKNDSTGTSNSGGNNSGNNSNTIPQNVISIAYSSYVKVSWDVVMGADYYKIYRASYSSASYIYNGTSDKATYYDNSPLTNNYYKVTAVINGKESEKSLYSYCYYSNGGGGGSYVFPDDFEFIYGFDNVGEAYLSDDYGYERVIPYHLGSEQTGLMDIGVQEIAMGLVCLDGNIYYEGPHWEYGIYIKRENNIIWYTVYPDNTAQNWTTFIIFEHQSTTTTRFKWTCRVKYNGVYYFEGERWNTEIIPSN